MHFKAIYRSNISSPSDAIRDILARAKVRRRKKKKVEAESRERKTERNFRLSGYLERARERHDERSARGSPMTFKLLRSGNLKDLRVPVPSI